MRKDEPAPPWQRSLREISPWRWFDRIVLDLGRQMRWSYLPPLMVYIAAGILHGRSIAFGCGGENLNIRFDTQI